MLRSERSELASVPRAGGEPTISGWIPSAGAELFRAGLHEPDSGAVIDELRTRRL